MPIVDPDHERVKDLSRQFAVATAHYEWALAELGNQRGIVSEEEYQRFCRVVEDARYQCELLRAMLHK